MLAFAYSLARLKITASKPPLVIVGIEAGIPANRVSGERCRNARHAAAGALRKHVLDRKLGDVDEPFEVCGDKGPKLVGGVIREGLDRKNAGTGDHVVD